MIASAFLCGALMSGIPMKAGLPPFTVIDVQVDPATTDQQIVPPTIAPTSLPNSPSQSQPASPRPDLEPSQDDVIVTARPHAPPGDPLQAINAKSFAATQAVDKALVGPVARAYGHAMPSPARSGLRNLLRNLHEPVVFANFLLQLKPGKAVETAGRFAINSTIGAAGLFDIAKRRPFNLPRRRNGFADTLGYYGVKPGPFMFLPIIGPTTVRDFIGTSIDRIAAPLSVGKITGLRGPAYAIPVVVLTTLDRRIEFDEQLTAIRQSSDPYAAARTFYLERRQAEIDGLRGKSRLPTTNAIPDAPPVRAPVPRPAPTWHRSRRVASAAESMKVGNVVRRSDVRQSIIAYNGRHHGLPAFFDATIPSF
jgi:phospholipid-binding lipoprotein MlaA